MCEYCNGDETLFKNDYHHCGRNDSIEAYQTGYDLFIMVDVNNENMTVNFKTNFCFMCGRDLNKTLEQKLNDITMGDY